MADPAAQLLEDRALRNAARGLLETDIAYIRESMTARSLSARLVDRVSGGARDIAGIFAINDIEIPNFIRGASIYRIIRLTKRSEIHQKKREQEKNSHV